MAQCLVLLQVPEEHGPSEMYLSPRLDYLWAHHGHHLQATSTACQSSSSVLRSFILPIVLAGYLVVLL